MNTIIESTLTLSLQKEKFRDQLLYFNTEKDPISRQKKYISAAHVPGVFCVYLNIY